MIFVSYRRQDSSYIAVTLKERIERRFGVDSVFFDIDNIPIGADFRKHIEAAVSQCQALLVVIGDKWLARVERTGTNRLFDPRDYVRMEIEAALGRGIPIVPILVEDATMPAPEDLPESIQEFVFRNAAEVRARDFEHHVMRLVDGLWRELESRPATSKPPGAPSAKTSEGEPQRVAKSKPPSAPPAKTSEGEPQRVAESKPPSAPPAKPLEVAPERVAKTNKLPKRHLAQKSVPERRVEPPKENDIPRPPSPSVRRAIPRLAISNLRFEFSGAESVYIGSSIPPRKLRNALDGYAPDVNASDVLLLYDDTVFGGAKNGFLLTRSVIYWRNLGGAGNRLALDELESVANVRGVQVNGRSIDICRKSSAEALTRVLNEILVLK